MSASDSDSIDWLASDDEDCESASESACKGGASTTKTLPLPVTSGAEPRAARPRRPAPDGDCSGVKEGHGCRDGGGCGTPCRSAEPGAGKGCSVLRLGRETQCGPLWRSSLYVPDRSLGEGPQRAPKRPHSTDAHSYWPWQHPVKTSNDERFARKCSELQCYVPHLSSILSGLQSGRYRQRLSSFQESVAMDRIQRIMGVLQNPGMGERYINIILKVEEMLRSWFPNVKPKDQLGSDRTDESTPSKRLKLCSAMTVESPMDLGVAAGNKAFGSGEPVPPGGYSATNLKWLHTSPICSPSAQLVLGRLRRWQAAPGGEDLTQDSSVSSSTDPPTPPPPPSVGQRRPPGKIVAPCLERLLKSTDSIVTRKGAADTLKESGWS